jgi:flagellar hook-basal body complex protein FliE
MTINAANAANAYASALQGFARPPAASPAEGFGNALQGVVGDVLAKGANFDAQAANIATGRAELVDLVTAVAETEVAVESLVAVRDKVISAYQEIMNMPI